ncbi:hypothetical protein [Lacinutrix himadriensis]|uniref:hypothetical protein n=1 Tax=Lacinutrix himadriensis TaxID=641549 RepID=UPI0006E130A1|nr:hypothetical protein [Lacinutrix himadriensis]
MATKQFTVNYYRAALGYQNAATWGNISIKIQGYITCYGSDHRFIMYFLHETSQVPQPTYIPANKVGAIFLPFKDMPIYLDMVRNEKPIYAYLNSSKPEWNSIKTASEPVGEEES